MNKITYLLLRVGIGVSMMGHGLVRLPKLTGFSNWMVHSFENSLIPKELVQPFSYLLPIAEFLLGIMLIVGLFTRQASVAGATIMIVLIFGSCLIEDWGAIPSQLIHLAFFAVLVQFQFSNSLAFDKLIDKRMA